MNCATCEQPMTRVGHSYRKEAAMSGMCAHCQDAYFGSSKRPDEYEDDDERRAVDSWTSSGAYAEDTADDPDAEGETPVETWRRYMSDPKLEKWRNPEARLATDDRPRCGTCNHVLGAGDMCLDDEGHPVDCDCEDDGLGRNRYSALEDFPVVEEAVEDVVTEPRLPDWIENSKIAQDSYRDLGDDDPDTRNPIDNPTCKGCGAWLSPVIKAMDDFPYCTKCIKDGVPTTTR